jgi:uncharacterized protein (DUF433 family)
MRPTSASSIDQLVTSEPGVLGGTAVFVGTRVPFTTFIEYLEAGQTVDEFVSDFPGVTRAQAVASLEAVRLMVEGRASAA